MTDLLISLGTYRCLSMSVNPVL